MNSTTPSPQRVNKAAVAEILGREYRPDGRPFTCRAVNNWMRFASLPHFKLGREVSFDPEAVRRWAAQRFTRGQRA